MIQARANPNSRLFCADRGQLGARLEDQPLGDPLVELALDPRGQLALVRQEGRGIDLEEIWCEALDADNGMGPSRSGEVLADPRLEIEPGPDGVAPQALDLGVLQLRAELALAFGLEPEFVDIPAVITLDVPQMK